MKLHILNTFWLDNFDKLIPHKKYSLSFLIHLKEKNDRNEKGKEWTDESENKVKIEKDNVASPTVSIDNIFNMAAIESPKRCDTATIYNISKNSCMENNGELIIFTKGTLRQLM